MGKVFAVATELAAGEFHAKLVSGSVVSDQKSATKPIELSIIIPVLNAEPHLRDTIQALQEIIESLSTEIVVVDGGSQDNSVSKAQILGARVVSSARGRGLQLSAGAREAKGRWMLFLHADTTLEPFWSTTVTSFVKNKSNVMKAAHFTFALDDASNSARRVEVLANWRARRFGLPYGDQGLLMSRQLYHSLVGFLDIPIMEDVDMVRRIGKQNLVELPATATTSAARYRRDGYWKRPIRNLSLLALYFLGVHPKRLAAFYD